MPSLSRPGAAQDAVLSMIPRVVYEPRTVDEAAEVVALTAREKMAVAFVGGGTDLTLGAPPRRLDAVVRTRGLSRVIEYAPSDMVLAAEAGMTLAEAQKLVATHRQQLSLDPPLPERATLGGIIAANSFGPRRARYGSARDVIIGVTLVRQDGERARGGGKVVKNVAGFDLPKMACGSLGTLALIATANFRLHPLPEASLTLVCPGTRPGQLLALVRDLVKAQLEPTSVVALRAGEGGFEVGVRFEGFAAGVAQQGDRFVALCRAAGFACEKLDEAAARGFWARHDAVRTEGSLRAKVAAPRAQVERVVLALAQLTSALRSPRFAWYATLGVGFLSGAAEGESAAAGVESARGSLQQLGGSLVLIDAPAAVRAKADVWGRPPPSFLLMQRLKDRFDPELRLNPGRFVGGL